MDLTLAYSVVQYASQSANFQSFLRNAGALIENGFSSTKNLIFRIAALGTVSEIPGTCNILVAACSLVAIEPPYCT